MDNTAYTLSRSSISIKLWPPSENTRKMLVERITNNLSTKSIFTEKYRCLGREEALENAHRIEDLAFVSANQHYENEPDGDGGSAVQRYAKECSKLILEVLKRGPAASEVSNELQLVENGIATPETFFDISNGKREFLEAEEAEKLLSPLKESNRYAKICFSNRSFGLDAARVAEPILRSLKDQLKEVDLSDFIAGRPEAEALEVMKIFSSALEGAALKSLNLSNNALGEKGVVAFGDLLKSQSSLEELYLMNNGISEAAAQAVCDLIPSTEKLKILHFHNNMTGDEGAIAIAEVVKCSPLLENFRCSSTRIGLEGGLALAQALETCTHLKKLDLRDNMFGVEVGISLSKALSKHPDLTEAYLSYLNLEDEGATAIFNALKESVPSLEVLEMAGNDITTEVAPTIVALLKSKQQLIKLNVSENELKDEGAIQIAEALELTQLKELDISSNSIRKAGAKALALAVADKLKFKLLNLNGNFIPDETIDELRKMFAKSPEILGPLDENDPDGGDDDEAEDEGSGDDELTSKVENLHIEDED
uniref:WPP domain-containing protein n=1 Tax=Kalanchoe fedtschenkoi TaxID=63787 RepID=A0A7N0TXE7_KALFE